ncbi:MAG: type VI secretion system tube protein Hcp [Terracidiphilus sp.]
MRLGNIKRNVVRCVLAGTLLSAVPAMAAVDMFLTIDGIKGEGPSGKMAVMSVNHNASMPAGMASGKRQHGEITITKEVDAASPKLMQAMNTHQALNNVTITFGSGSGAGKAALQTLNLKNAMITSVRVTGRTETITIEYGTVMATWTDGGKTATDDWEAPN